jgi:hypothetical protein
MYTIWNREKVWVNMRGSLVKDKNSKDDSNKASQTGGNINRFV